MSEKKQITVCICYDGDKEKLNKTIASFGDSYAALVKTVVLEHDAAMAAAQVTTEYVTVISAGEAWHGTALEQAVKYLSSAGDAADAVLCEHVTRKTPEKGGTPAGGKVVSLSKAKEILRLPGSLRGIIFRTEAIREQLPDLTGEDGWDELSLCQILWQK